MADRVDLRQNIETILVNRRAWAKTLRARRFETEPREIEAFADELAAALALPAEPQQADGNWWEWEAIDVIRHARTDGSANTEDRWENAIRSGLLRAYNRGIDAARASATPAPSARDEFMYGVLQGIEWSANLYEDIQDYAPEQIATMLRESKNDLCSAALDNLRKRSMAQP